MRSPAECSQLGIEATREGFPFLHAEPVNSASGRTCETNTHIPPAESVMLPPRVSSVTEAAMGQPHSKRRSRSHSLTANRTAAVSPSSKNSRSGSVDMKSLPSSVQKNLSYGAKFYSMSIIRRYFLFFVFLDLTIHFLAYLLYLRHARDFNLMDLIQCQMKCYDIQTSLVDVIMLAVGRFLILESAYGLGRSTSWFGTGLTTAITNVFIIVKPFHYDWEAECQRLLAVSLIALSFVLAWLEAFLVDFRLIGMENLAQKYATVRPEVLGKDFPKVGFLKSVFPITRDLFSFAVRSEES